MNQYRYKQQKKLKWHLARRPCIRKEITLQALFPSSGVRINSWHDSLTVTYQANEAIMFYRVELDVQGCHTQQVSGKQHTHNSPYNVLKSWNETDVQHCLSSVKLAVASGSQVSNKFQARCESAVASTVDNWTRLFTRTMYNWSQPCSAKMWMDVP